MHLKFVQSLRDKRHPKWEKDQVETAVFHKRMRSIQWKSNLTNVLKTPPHSIFILGLPVCSKDRRTNLRKKFLVVSSNWILCKHLLRLLQGNWYKQLICHAIICSLNDRGQNCLDAGDVSAADWEEFEAVVSAGQSYTVDEQCQFTYGPDSAQCGEVSHNIFLPLSTGQTHTDNYSANIWASGPVV